MIRHIKSVILIIYSPVLLVLFLAWFAVAAFCIAVTALYGLAYEIAGEI